jgi:hypothetical protein
MLSVTREMVKEMVQMFVPTQNYRQWLVPQKISQEEIFSLVLRHVVNFGHV